MSEEDETIKRFDQQIRQLEGEKAKYVEQKQKKKVVDGLVDKFLKRLDQLCIANGVTSMGNLENELGDVSCRLESLFDRLYAARELGTAAERDATDRMIKESIGYFESRKKQYAVDMDALISSLKEMKEKKK